MKRDNYEDFNVMSSKFQSERGWISTKDIKELYHDNLPLMSGEYFDKAKAIAIDRLPPGAALNRWIEWCDACVAESDDRMQFFGLLNRDEIPDKIYTQFFIYLRPYLELLRDRAVKGSNLICDHEYARIENGCLSLPFFVSNDPIENLHTSDQCSGDLIEYEAFGRQIERVSLVFSGFSHGWYPNWEIMGVLLELSDGEITVLKGKHYAALKWDKGLKLLPENPAGIYEELIKPISNGETNTSLSIWGNIKKTIDTQSEVRKPSPVISTEESDPEYESVRRSKFVYPRFGIDMKDIRGLYDRNIRLELGEYFDHVNCVDISDFPSGAPLLRWMHWCDQCDNIKSGSLYGLINRDDISDRKYTQLFIYLRPALKLLGESTSLVCYSKDAKIENDNLTLYIYEEKRPTQNHNTEFSVDELIEYQAIGRQVKSVILQITGYEDLLNLQEDGVLLELENGRFMLLQGNPVLPVLTH